MIAGCAITPDTNIKTNVSSFDGSKSIATATNVVDCNIAICSFTSFAWDNRQSDIVVMKVTVEDGRAKNPSYHPISSVRLNIDGNIVNLKPYNNVNNDMSSKSLQLVTSRLFEMNVNLLEQIQNSKETKIQIVSKDEIFEEDFKKGNSYPVMTDLLSKVKLEIS